MRVYVPYRETGGKAHYIFPDQQAEAAGIRPTGEDGINIEIAGGEFLPFCKKGTASEFVSAALLGAAVGKGMYIALAESCTGGAICTALTDFPGSSRCLWGGVVCYSNASKEAVLAVRKRSLEAYGAVSPEVAREMLTGLAKISAAQAFASVTGIAGPGGSSDKKPAGLVYTAVAIRKRRNLGDIIVRKFMFTGDREEIRNKARVAVSAQLAERILNS